nr:MAG TPA: protein of unknown function (DUF4519) [Caudoviricetes sp.]
MRDKKARKEFIESCVKMIVVPLVTSVVTTIVLHFLCK